MKTNLLPKTGCIFATKAEQQMKKLENMPTGRVKNNANYNLRPFSVRLCVS